MPRIISVLSVFSVASVAAISPTAWAQNPLGNPEGMVDRLVMWDAADEWAQGERDDLIPTGDRLILGREPSTVIRSKFILDYPESGRWTSPAVSTEYAFTELIPSWNPIAPPQTGMRLEVRAHDAATQEWSPWLYAGFWGDVVRRPNRTVEFASGEVNIDTVTLTEPADAFQLRATLQSFDLTREAWPSLRRVAAVYSGVVEDQEQFDAFTETPRIQGQWVTALPVPHLAQGSLGRPLSSQRCSPTSVSMVLASLGAGKSLLENSLAIYDPEYGLFGNWGRAVAYAGSQGLDAWITRYRTWDQVKATIASGQPIIASVNIERGEVEGIRYDGGHLIVIRGFEPDGDVILNDPGVRAPDGDGSVWTQRELETVWFDHGGVAYIIRSPQN